MCVFNIAIHVDDEDKGTAPIQGTAYETRVTVINEAGFTHLSSYQNSRLLSVEDVGAKADEIVGSTLAMPNGEAEG